MRFKKIVRIPDEEINLESMQNASTGIFREIFYCEDIQILKTLTFYNKQVL